jgi:hypothetical protein
MRKFTTQRLLAFGMLAAIAALAACGGGGGTSSTPGVHTTSAPAAPGPGLAPASFSIKIPGSGSSSVSRRTQAVNAATSSISFTLISTDAAGVTVPQTSASFNVGAGSSLCTNGAAGARSCTVGMNAPLGNDIYTAQTFDANGNKLGSSAVSLKVLQNVTNAASISLGGTVTGVLITATSQIEAGSPFSGLDATNGPKSMRVIIIGFDSLGNVILTPDTFSTPISFVFDLLPVDNNSSTKRRTKTAATPIVQATVTYANPNGGPATATTTDLGAPIIITSPNDVVTVTALSPPPQVDTAFIMVASVGAPPAVLPASAPTPAPGGIAPPLSGLGLIIAGTPSTPPPLPQVASMTWKADQPGMSFVPPQVFQFVNAQAPGANITLHDFTATGGPATGSITIDSPSWNTFCTPEFASPGALPISGTLAPDGTFTILVKTLASGGATPPSPLPSAPIPTPFPTGGQTCELIATDGVGTTSTLTINVNNPTGTIQ